MKAEPMSTRQWKEYLTLFLAAMLIIVAFDYLFAAEILQYKTAKTFFYKSGEIWRGLYFLMFAITCFYHAKANVAEGKSLVVENSKKIVLFIISFACITGLLFINSIPAGITMFVYPVLFIVANFCVAVLVLSYMDPGAGDQQRNELGVEKEPSEKPLAIVFKVKGGWINVSNPFRSSLVIGGAGAGKSKSIIEPMTFDAIKKNYAVLMYDFKFPTLGNYLYSCLSHHNAEKLSFYSIAFTDVARSNRFNPIDPKLLFTSTYAEEYSWTLYSNLDKEGAKKGGFFPESASSLLKAVIWFMKKKHPEYCTLPHVMNLILTAQTETLVKMLSSDPETAGMCKPVAEAASRKDAGAQLAGVVGSLTMQLGKINTPEVCWVLTGNDFDLQLNNPSDPKCLVLGNSPQVEQALSPVLAFICNIALKLMNDHKKNHSLVILDEAPSLTIPNIEKIPATARSNKLGLVYCAQDFSQMDKYLGPESRKAIVSNLASQFYGQISSLDTAKYASELLGKEWVNIKSKSSGTSSSDSGDSTSSNTSYSEQQRDRITPQQFLEMPTGTFVGKLVEGTIDWFKASFEIIENLHPDFKEKEIPVFVTDFLLNEEEIENAQIYAGSLAEDPEALYANSDYHDFIRSVSAQLSAIYGDDFLLSDTFKELLLKEVVKQRQKAKTLRILEQNFSHIVDEVKELASLYEAEDINTQYEKLMND